jgi:hypothetical protein
MRLWQKWFQCVQALRPACARHCTFVWRSLVLAGLSIRADLAGVSSFVRALGLKGSCYRRLLYVCHTPGLQLEVLSASWVRLVLKLFTPLRLGGRVVMIGDGLKVGKEGKKMPAVNPKNSRGVKKESVHIV